MYVSYVRGVGIHMNMWLCSPLHVCTCGAQKSISGIFFSHLSFWDRVSLRSDWSSSVWLDKLDSKGPEIHPSPPSHIITGVNLVMAMISFNHGSWRSKFGSSSLYAVCLTHESSLQQYSRIFRRGVSKLEHTEFLWSEEYALSLKVLQFHLV